LAQSSKKIQDLGADNQRQSLDIFDFRVQNHKYPVIVNAGEIIRCICELSACFMGLQIDAWPCMFRQDAK
jgi:hypothetical protein